MITRVSWDMCSSELSIMVFLSVRRKIVSNGVERVAAWYRNHDFCQAWTISLEHHSKLEHWLTGQASRSDCLKVWKQYIPGFERYVTGITNDNQRSCNANKEIGLQLTWNTSQGLSTRNILQIKRCVSLLHSAHIRETKQAKERTKELVKTDALVSDGYSKPFSLEQRKWQRPRLKHECTSKRTQDPYAMPKSTAYADFSSVLSCSRCWTPVYAARQTRRRETIDQYSTTNSFYEQSMKMEVSSEASQGCTKLKARISKRKTKMKEQPFLSFTII